jgi:DNA-binding transcriptional ArsR family regulator
VADDGSTGYTAESSDVVLSDAPAIRVLAHPARLLAVERLYAAHGSTFTATELADEVGLTPSAMSYHLRALEKHGVVARAVGDGDDRRRPWRAAGTRLVVKRAPGQNPAGRAAVELLAGEMIDRLRSSLQAMSDRLDDDVERWRVGGLSPATLRLGPEQTSAMTTELEEVLERYRALEDPSGEDVRVVEILLAVVPGPPRT